MKNILVCLMFYAIIVPFAAKSQASLHFRLGSLEPTKYDTKSVITLEHILKNKRLTTSSENIKITGYSFSLLPDGAEFIGPYQVQGDSLTDKVVSEIRSCRSGRICIDHINYEAHHEKFVDKVDNLVYKYRKGE